MKNFLLLLLTVVILHGCGTSNLVPNDKIPRTLPAFVNAPKSNSSPGSLKMSIAIVKPVFVSKDAEFMVSPFPEMATTMGHDFEEMLTAKGFTVKGPFDSRDNMVYTEKKTTDFILQIEIDLRLVSDSKYNFHSDFNPLLFILSLGMGGWDDYYTTEGIITLGGSLIITAMSPQYGEKLWKKQISLVNKTYKYTGNKKWISRPSTADQLQSDNKFYNLMVSELEEYYKTSLDVVWSQIDPEEMKIITKQAKEADGRNS